MDKPKIVTVKKTLRLDTGKYLVRARNGLAKKLDRPVTQAEVAGLVGVARMTYCSWEWGTAVPNPANCIKLSEVLEFDRNEFMAMAWPEIGKALSG